MNDDLIFYTCRELIEQYQFIRLWKWNSVKIGVFYNCLLLDGRRYGKNSQVMITKSSFENLMEFAKASLEVNDILPEYCTYEEVLNEHPQTIFYRWTPTTIGIFRSSGLLEGKKCRKEGKNLVTLQSVNRLVNYTSQRFYNIAHGKM